MEKTKEFSGDWIDEQLRECQEQGYKALFIPQLADRRIKAKKGSKILKNWYTTPSLRATGKTKQGNPVVAYVHADNYFSNPDNVKQARQNLVNGAGILPQSEFQRYLDLEDNKNVFVIDYNNLRSSTSGLISIENALEHPQTIPFLGGEERAKNYLKKHQQVYGNQIGILHSDDLKNEPLGRLLYLGNYYYNSPVGYYNLYNDARFFGVRESAEGTSQKIARPTLEQVLKIARPFITEISKGQFREKLKKLYK